MSRRRRTFDDPRETSRARPGNICGTTIGLPARALTGTGGIWIPRVGVSAKTENDMKTEIGWWKLGGSNLQAVYGYGTRAEADEYCTRVLNDGRDVNLYAPHWLGETDEEALAATGRVSMDDGCNLAESLADLEEGRA